LHEGAGADTLTGGAGEDVFIFDRDGSVDRITDFQDGVDRLDVSSWGRIYSAQSLLITSTATGAEIAFGDERLIITSAAGGPLAASAFSDADFIF
jgi:Ca2+-binding RTX toxin-like protein